MSMRVTVDAPEVGQLTFACHDDHLYRVMEKTGQIYEYRMLEYIAENVPRDGVFLDIGACIGTHSIFFAKLGVPVWAFEPVPENYVLLKKNVTINRPLSAITMCPCALGDVSGMVAMQTYPTNMGRARIVERAEDSTIPLDTLDHVLPADVQVTLMKIDVEGYELQVLKGARKTLERWHPWLFVEVRQTAFATVHAFLTQCGYVKGRRFCAIPTIEFRWEPSCVSVL